MFCNSWVLLHHYAVWVGVKLGCIDAYAVLEANNMKLHVFVTKHKTNTYHKHLLQSDDCVSI